MGEWQWSLGTYTWEVHQLILDFERDIEEPEEEETQQDKIESDQEPDEDASLQDTQKSKCLTLQQKLKALWS